MDRKERLKMYRMIDEELTNIKTKEVSYDEN